jgi:hypothetical protein
MHEEAGAWSWILHEFDVPPGVTEIELSADVTHPKTVAISWDFWQSDT